MTSPLLGQQTSFELSHHTVSYTTYPIDKEHIYVVYKVKSKAPPNQIQLFTTEVYQLQFSNFKNNPYYSTFPFKKADWNFDGYDDLAIYSDCAGGLRGQPVYKIYLFDTTKHQFVFHDQLSALSIKSESGKLEPQKTEKAIYQYIYYDTGHDAELTYKWKDNQLVQTTEHSNYHGAVYHSESIKVFADEFSITFENKDGSSCKFHLEFIKSGKKIVIKTGPCEELADYMRSIY
ncbi:MAG: hypothetical protein AB8E82_16300 [Aureispira sp.]